MFIDIENVHGIRWLHLLVAHLRGVGQVNDSNREIQGG